MFALNVPFEFSFMMRKESKKNFLTLNYKFQNKKLNKLPN